MLFIMGFIVLGGWWIRCVLCILTLLIVVMFFITRYAFLRLGTDVKDKLFLGGFAFVNILPMIC